MRRLGLRGRLLLVIVGAGAALLLAVASAREWVARRAGEQALRAALEARLDGLDRERCESGQHPFFRQHGPRPRGLEPGHDPRDPEPPFTARGEGFGGPPGGAPEFGPGGPRRGGPRPLPFELHAYAADFTPTTKGPPLPTAVRAALTAGSPWVTGSPEGLGRGLVGAMPTAWKVGGCAYVALSLQAPPSIVPGLTFGLGALALLLALGGVVTLAAGSTVERIRALAREVDAVAARRYDAKVTVEGGDEIAELAAAFNVAAAAVRAHVEEVEAREGALRGFVANTTHDVGVPLSALAGHVTALRETQGSAPDPRLLDAAAQEVHYIGSLLRNLGAAARLETGDGLREAGPVDLAALVERVAVRHAVLARAAGVELNHAVPEAGLAVHGDVTLLEQAVDNLAHNAIRYNRAGGHVALVLERAQGGGRFAVRVVDDGPGVAAGELAHLAESRFRGGLARSRRPEGSGLGLAIASEAAALHGFQLELRNAEGGGFEATLTGPAAT